jgi:predicted tellurium resistance membrane protein TerC
MFEWIASPEAWIALATLTALEIVLGIDNIIFISILVSRLPEQQREFGRRVGLALAMLTRLALLFSIAWVMGFLLYKSTQEIHQSMEGVEEETSVPIAAGLAGVLVQIAILDIVFSLDSVITAVGLVDYVSIMAIAIVIAVCIMLLAAKPIGDFVDRHPTVKVLALSFLILVGVTLIVEGFDVHVPKGYIYFAMAFSVTVEMLNIRMRRKAEPVKLHKQYSD